MQYTHTQILYTISTYTVSKDALEMNLHPKKVLLYTIETGFIHARHSSCHPTNSVKALKETQSNDTN